MEIKIYHNPNCGTSRNTLAMIRNTGVEPQVIEYLKTPPTREELKELIAKAGLTVREAIREKGTPYAELGLDNPSLTDDQLLDAMLAHRQRSADPRTHARGHAGVRWFAVL